MKKIIFLILLVVNLFSQEAQIINIQAAQRTDGSQLVDIYYDLLPDQFFNVFTITLEIGLGNSFIDINEGLSGDIGQGMTSGDLKHIIWDVGNHPVFNNSFFENLTLRLNGESIILEELPFDMVSINSGYFNDCGIDGNIDYDYSIMQSPVTNAQYAQFLIEQFQSNELVSNDIGFINGNTGEVLETYNAVYDNEYDTGGDFNILYIDLSNSDHGYNCGISWNGITFIVDEGQGSEYAECVTWYGANAFAEYYSLRLPTLNEWIKAMDESSELISLSQFESIANNLEIVECSYEEVNDYPNQEMIEITDFDNDYIPDSYMITINPFRCVGNQ